MVEAVLEMIFAVSIGRCRAARAFRRVCRNVKHWLDAAMALRWTGAAMLEAAKGFRRLKAHRQLPILKAALAAHGARHTNKPVLERQSAAV